MCKCSSSRIEVLPTGEKVFYIDIGNIPPAEVSLYMEMMMERMKKVNPEDKESYFVPIRPTPCVHTGITTEQLLILSTVIIFVSILVASYFAK